MVIAVGLGGRLLLQHLQLLLKLFPVQRTSGGGKERRREERGREITIEREGGGERERQEMKRIEIKAFRI